jgi:hypothetical protein
MQTQNPGAAAMLTMVTAAFTFAYAASAADIGFIVNTGNDPNPLEDPFDAGWVARLGTQGHTVAVFNAATSADDATLATMDLLIVSQDVGSGTFLSGIGINQPMPILSYEYGIYDDMFGGSNGNAAGASSGVTIVDPLHPLAAGLSGDVSIYTGSQNISYLAASSVSSGTEIIALSVATPANGVFAVLEAGQPGKDGNTFSASRMALPCYENWDPNLVTADGWKLLDGAVVYALTPSAVPEPSTLALFGFGAAVLLARRQGRRESAI